MVKLNTTVVACIGIITCILLLLYVLAGSALQPLEQKKPAIVYATYNAPFGKLFLTSNISDQPQSITHYHVTPRKNDMIYYVNGDPINIGNISSENESSQVALRILDQYGGLPEGAGPLEAHTEYIEHFSGTNSWQPSELIPESVVINCQRSLDDKPVIGGYIRMELGFNNELLSLRKIWRTVTPAGTIQVISPKEALQKILRGDVLNEPLKCTCDLTVDNIILAYRENGYNESQEYLEPVWDFKGTLSSGGSYRYIVSALKLSETSDNSYIITEVHTPPETDISLNNPPTTIESGNNSK